ncbi:MAG TPA: TonB-dependent receptor [Paraburkholderia sp.]|nr:TonB-dependent receptor [Paraburkholderia sp.]
MLALLVLPDALPAQTAAGETLPPVTITAPNQKQAPRRVPRPTRQLRAVVASKKRTAPPVAQTPPAPTPLQIVADKNKTFDASRNNIYQPIGTVPYTVSHDAIDALPQGTNQSFDKVLLQAPGVNQDSAASGDLHIRNEHANVQYRINGIMLPDGVTGFGQILDSSIIGKFDLITGALPAQFGLRTAAVVDIQTRDDLFNNTGQIGFYGGSHSTLTPTIEYGGTVGQTQFFLSSRYLFNTLGIENPTPAAEAIHDNTNQQKGFLYISTLLDPSNRVTLMSGVSNASYQIPNNPGQPPMFTAFGVSNFNSSQLNEQQTELSQFNVLAFQHKGDDVDFQVAYFNRNNILHFTPDLIGDLVFNGVASDVYRRSNINGIQEDTAYRLNDDHTLRFGLMVSTENSLVRGTSTLLPLDANGNPVDAPFTIIDSSEKTGYELATYLQDEWRLTRSLTLNVGLRFDQMWQYVDANQLSPRASLTWKPLDDTTFHLGYARNFTPPQQVVAAPTNLALVANTTQQPAVTQNDPVQPERSNVYDVGVVQKNFLVHGLQVGLDAYYKEATDLLDDGQFGAAYVLNGFNYAQGRNIGVELSAKYVNGPFNAYGNIAWAQQKAIDPVSNQYLFDPATFAYAQTNWIYTDHTQIWTGSAGASYLFSTATKVSFSMIYGSGLRSGFANTDHVPPYTQFNAGIQQEFTLPGFTKPTTVRFDVVNLFDTVYEIRDGSGIGVFAPQYGPRRGYFAGITQRF